LKKACPLKQNGNCHYTYQIPQQKGEVLVIQKKSLLTDGCDLQLKMASLQKPEWLP